MKRRKYPSDVTDQEWEILKKHLPEPSFEGNRKYELREIVNGIYYLLRTGCGWEYLPHDLPHYKSCRGYFEKWAKNQVWECAQDEVVKELRKKLGKEAEPSVGILDSQSIKTSDSGEAVGYDGGKKIKGRKRHLMVDTNGFPLACEVTGADVGDREGGKQIVDEYEKKSQSDLS